MAEQDLLPSNRARSEKAQHWLPDKGGAHCCSVDSVSCRSWALERAASEVVYGCSCQLARGIFPGQGSNPCSLNEQVYS